MISDSVSKYISFEEDLIWAIKQRHECLRRINSDISFEIPRHIRYESIREFKEGKITEKMATMLPDHLIMFFQNKTSNSFEGCFLLGKISGVMDLLHFNEENMSSAPEITKTLNHLLGPILVKIMTSEGDIWSLSPDSFLAFWKSTDETLKYHVQNALNCALVVQNHFRKLDTKKETLKVKLVLTAGQIAFSILSNYETSSYVCVGQPVDDLEMAEKIAHFDDIVVDPSAWQYVNTAEYSSLPIGNENYHKIVGIGFQWKMVGQDYMKNRRSRSDSSGALQLNNLDIDSDQNLLRRTEDCSVRPIVNNLQGIRDQICSFMIAPVLNVLYDEVPLESLEEIRQLIVMFVTVEMELVTMDNMDIVNHCYKIVCSKSKDHKGAILRSSVIRSNVCFVVLFGLKGLSAVTESQEALRCATRCRQELKLVDESQAVTVSCVTGKCYCGVFGHTLRRDYAPYGSCLVRAERMTVAYPDKLTCDKTTFIHSNLNSENFTLLDEVENEGDLGPIFQFTEDNVTLFSQDIRRMPLLGRDKELSTFRKLFGIYLKNFGIKPCCKYAKCSFKNCIVIDGIRKQGKSRLLYEFARDAQHAEVQMVNFYENDYMGVYNGVRQILGATLGFGYYMSEYVRRQKITDVMGSSSTTDLLYALNDVFDVNFEKPQRRTLSEEETDERKERGIKILCSKSFEKPTLILMDNADFMDQASWNLLLPMLETKCLFVVATVDKTRTTYSNLEGLLKSPNVEMIRLMRIPQIHLAGVTCQILRVYAIPAELEKVIQSNSLGNPGWIEHFLLALRQTKKIETRLIGFESIREMALVAPPLYMLRRLPEEAICDYKYLLEERSAHHTEVLDPWDVYLDSCRDTFKDVDLRSDMQEIFFKERRVPVCVFTDDFNVKQDVDPNVTEDLTFLELYDRLSYQEQLMLRCSSVLGDPFTRRVLFHLWSPTSERIGAEVVENLFNKGVIGCAGGDFSTGGDYILIRHEKINPDKERRVECRCVGLDINESCHRMSKYASCGFMRFWSSQFANAIYQQISESDRIELHRKAANFLKKETRRCVSCGCGYFPDKFGCKMDSNELGRMKHPVIKVKEYPELENMEQHHYSSDFSKLALTKPTDERGTISFLSRNYSMSLSSEDRYIDQSYLDKYGRSFKFSSPLQNNRLRRRPSLVRTFSKADFLSCQCHLILNHLYKRLKHHYKNSEQWHNMIVACIHYSRISMANKNFASSLSTVNEALNILINESHILKDPDWKVQMLTGKFYCLKGNILMELDQVEEAHEIYLKAMESFGLPFPKDDHSFGLSLRLFQEKVKQKLRFYFLSGSYLNEVDQMSYLYISNSIAETLAKLCRIYMAKRQWKLAQLAAVMSLKNSLQTETNLIRICDSFSLMLMIAQHFETKFLCINLEVHALRYCHRKRNYVEPPELKAIAHLYVTVFEARLARAEYDSALHIGYIVISIATRCREMSISIQLFTLICHMQIERLLISEATVILRELEFFADEIDNDSGRMWYCAFAVLFHLETGYILSPFSSIETFYSSEAYNFNNKYYEAKMRLIVTMWVWYLRNNQWENTYRFTKELQEYRKYSIDSNNHAINFLYLLEGTLLSLVNKINQRSISGIMTARKEVERLLKKLHHISPSRQFIKPKLYLLHAYYSYILENVDRTKKLLAKSRRYCSQYENHMVLVHLEHSEKAWSNEISHTVRDFWKNHCKNETYISYHEMDYENLKIYCFTYPKPLFRV